MYEIYLGSCWDFFYIYYYYFKIGLCDFYFLFLYNNRVVRFTLCTFFILLLLLFFLTNKHILPWLNRNHQQHYNYHFGDRISPHNCNPPSVSPLLEIVLRWFFFFSRQVKHLKIFFGAFSRIQPKTSMISYVKSFVI